MYSVSAAHQFGLYKKNSTLIEGAVTMLEGKCYCVNRLRESVGNT